MIQQVVIALFVVSMIVAVGLDISLDDVRGVGKLSKLFVVGLCLNYLVVPGINLALVTWVSLPPAAAAAIFLIGAAGGGPIGAMFTQAHRGNLVFSAGLMLLLNVLNTFITPALCAVFIDLPQTETGNPALEMMKTIVLFQVIPLLGAIGFRHWQPRAANRVLPFAKRFSQAVLVLLVVGLGVVHGRSLFQVTPIVFIVSLVAVASSWLISVAITPGPWEDRLAMAFTTTFRSMSLVVLLIGVWFPDPVTLFTALVYTSIIFTFSVVAGWCLRFVRK